MSRPVKVFEPQRVSRLANDLELAAVCLKLEPRDIPVGQLSN
jgi:hypothetical protein